MTIDYLSAIQSHSEAIAAAIDANRAAPVPWCGDWTVQDVARHVGGLQHVIVGVIDGRPTANFGLFKTLHPPAADDPALAPWVREGTATLLERLRATAPEEPCWTFWEPVPNVGFWARRTAHETFVHAWDATRAAGLTSPAAEPEFAADGVDEYLDLFVGMTRGLHSAPGAGETVHVHCTDTAGEWFVEFPAPGERTLRREHAKGDVAFRGPAEGLLLFLWGRMTAAEAGVEIVGDAALAARWPELAPSI